MGRTLPSQRWIVGLLYIYSSTSAWAVGISPPIPAKLTLLYSHLTVQFISDLVKSFFGLGSWDAPAWVTGLVARVCQHLFTFSVSTVTNKTVVWQCWAHHHRLCPVRKKLLSIACGNYQMIQLCVRAALNLQSLSSYGNRAGVDLVGFLPPSYVIGSSIHRL